MMRVSYDVEMPKKNNRRKWNELYDFLRSDHTTVCFEYDDVATAKRCAANTSCVKSQKKLKLRVSLRDNKVYIQKQGVIAYE